MAKSTFSVGSLTDLNLLGRNLARAIKKCTLFLENYSVEILVCTKIYTQTVTEKISATVFLIAKYEKKKVEMPIRRVLDMGHGKPTSIQRKLSHCYNGYNGSNYKWSANGSR